MNPAANPSRYGALPLRDAGRFCYVHGSASDGELSLPATTLTKRPTEPDERLMTPCTTRAPARNAPFRHLDDWIPLGVAAAAVVSRGEVSPP